jgi:hypothetical protein
MEVLKARWIGTNDRDDPDSIVHHGVRYNKNEWTDVPFDKENEAHLVRKAKLLGHPHFQVKGTKPGGEEAAADLPPPAAGPVRAPSTKYSVRGNKKDGWEVVDQNGHRVGDDVPFKTAEDAQTAADMLNAPKP